MSRVGNKPIPLPKGVKITVGEQLQVEGPKGKLTVPIPPGIKIQEANGNVQLARESDEQAATTPRAEGPRHLHRSCLSSERAGGLLSWHTRIVSRHTVVTWLLPASATGSTRSVTPPRRARSA